MAVIQSAAMSWKRASVAAAVTAAVGMIQLGCPGESCLRGACEEVRACDGLEYTCEPAGTLYVGPVAGAPAELRLARGEGADDDILVSNGVVTAVIDAIAAPHGLAPTGGTLLDLGAVGAEDDLVNVYQIAGILPDDALAYETLELVDRAPDYVAVIARGRLDGRDEVDVLTRYELRPCDPGVRVRTELFNGSPEAHAWVVADVSQWGTRKAVPFASRPGQGYVQPELDLLELQSLYDSYDVGAAWAPSPTGQGYAVAACNQGALDGINDLQISALGTSLELVRPGESVVLERLWTATGAGEGPADAVETALGVRQQLLGDAAPLIVAGRVVVDDAGTAVGLGGDVRRASVVVLAGDGDGATPLGHVIPAADGTFRVAVPPNTEALRYEVSSFGRVVASGAVPAEGNVGDVMIEAPGRLTVTVSDGDMKNPRVFSQVVVLPADDATDAAVRGTFHGRFDACAPWLGPPHGGAPACNRVLVPPEGLETFELPAGRYDVYATAGPEFTLAQRLDVEVAPGEEQGLILFVQPLDVVPDGWLTADLHVHGRASFDSAIPDEDRVQTFVSAGVDVIAATDHDFVVDYAATIAALGLGDRVRVMGGIETTQLIPWMDVPDEDFPKVIGHFNFWPLVPVPGAFRGGAPWDELVEPGALYDLMDPLIGGEGIRLMNHPWDESQSGRDLGYLRAIGYDPRVPIPDADDGSRNGMLQRAPAGGRRNLEWNAIEVGNGAGVQELMKARVLWWSLISQGYPVAGVANSDSHGLTDQHLGWARTYVATGGDLAGFDEDTFNAAVRAGKTGGGSGVFVSVEVGPAAGPRRGLGLEPYAPAAGDVVAIEVRAAPWIDVSEVRVVTSAGVRVLASGGELSQPADPLGTDGVVRYQATIPVEDLLDAPGTGDDWFSIEAGLPLPAYADLDDDGVPDTGDNNGDGVIDARDVEDPDDDAGPMNDPEPPGLDEVDAPRFWMTRVVPYAFPYAFTSPILVDRDGGGWTAPGVGGGA